MALLFMDGFDHYASGDGTEKWVAAGGGIQTTYKRTGAGASSTGAYQISLPASGSTAIFGMGLYIISGAMEIRFCYGAVNSGQCSIKVTSLGAIEAYRGNNGDTLLGTTAAGVVRFSAWGYLEAKFVLSQTVGTVTVKYNGATVLSLSGLDTCALAGVAWDTFYTYTSSQGYMDDLYVCDGSGSQNNDLLGECRVVTLLPQTDAVAAGSNADFTPSTSTDHGALVDEAAPNDDTDYLSSSTLNHVDSWEYPALGYTGTIKGVQMNLSARKTDSGTRAIAAVTKPASTNRVHGTNHYIGTSYAYWLSIWELNPEDSAAWEVADVDGAEFGVKVTV